jgi:HPt (histidine-containing phosphotransfer) domain-containing protein
MSEISDKMADLRRRFAVRAYEDAARIQVAFEAGDHVEVRALAHRLAGAAGIFGFAEVGEAARALEDAPQDRDRIDALSAHAQAPTAP